MHRKFIAFILGSSIAIASATTAAPARADGDFLKALAGFTALAIIGKSISDAQNKPTTYVAPKQKQPIHQVAPRASKVRPLPQAVRRFDLPRNCLHSYRVRGQRDFNVYGARCLRSNFAGFNALPQQCKTHFRVSGQRRAAFDPSCLNNFGYRVARR